MYKYTYKISVSKYIDVYVCTYVYIHAHAHTRTRWKMCACVCMFICVFRYCAIDRQSIEASEPAPSATIVDDSRNDRRCLQIEHNSRQ